MVRIEKTESLRVAAIELADACSRPRVVKSQFLIVMALFILAGCAGSTKPDGEMSQGSTMPGVAQMPIVFDKMRRQLSLQYLRDRYGMEQSEPTIVPKMVVAHWTSIPTLAETFDAFDPAQLPGTRGDVMSAGALNVSSHYLVDRDGTIYQLLPETTLARHVIGLNHTAIGIENVGNGTDLPLTDRQLDANVRIIRYLHSKYEIEYLIGHHEYQDFEGHALWKEKDSGYRTSKIDPGVRFMSRLRERVSALRLNGPPANN